MVKKGRFSSPAWRKIAEEEFARQSALIVQAETLANESKSLRYDFVNPAAASESRIINSVTRNIADLLSVDDSTRIGFRLSKGVLGRWPVNQGVMKLTVSRERLIRALSHEFILAEDLARFSGFKDANSVRQVIAKIKGAFRSTFGLPVSLIEAREGFGYRLSDIYEVILDD